MTFEELIGLDPDLTRLEEKKRRYEKLGAEIAKDEAALRKKLERAMSKLQGEGQTAARRKRARSPSGGGLSVEVVASLIESRLCTSGPAEPEQIKEFVRDHFAGRASGLHLVLSKAIRQFGVLPDGRLEKRVGTAK